VRGVPVVVGRRSAVEVAPRQRPYGTQALRFILTNKLQVYSCLGE